MKKLMVEIKKTKSLLLVFLLLSCFYFTLSSPVQAAISQVYHLYTANIEQNINTLDNATARSYILNMTEAGFNMISINNYASWASDGSRPYTNLKLWNGTGYQEYTAEEAFGPSLNASLYARSIYPSIEFYPVIELVQPYGDLLLWNITQVFPWLDYINYWEPMNNQSLRNWDFNYWNTTAFVPFPSAPGFTNVTTAEGWKGSGTLLNYNFTLNGAEGEFFNMRAGHEHNNPLQLNLTDYDEMYFRLMTNGTARNLRLRYNIYYWDSVSGTLNSTGYDSITNELPPADYPYSPPVWYLAHLDLNLIPKRENISAIILMVGENNVNVPNENASVWLDDIYFRKNEDSGGLAQLVTDVHNDGGMVFREHAWDAPYATLSTLLDYVDGWGGAGFGSASSVGWDTFDGYDADNYLVVGCSDIHGYDFESLPMTDRTFWAKEQYTGAFTYLGYYNNYEEEYYFRETGLGLPMITYTNSVLLWANYTIEDFQLDLSLNKTAGEEITLRVYNGFTGEPKNITVNSVLLDSDDYTYSSTTKETSLTFTSQGSNTVVFEFYGPSTNSRFRITNMDAGDYLFTDKTYYFEAKYIGLETGMGVAKLRFSDGESTVQVSYNHVSGVYSLESGSSIAQLATVTVVADGYTIWVTFNIQLKNLIMDAQTVFVYLWSATDKGSTTNLWDRSGSAFNILNLGGFSTLTTSPQAANFFYVDSYTGSKNEWSKTGSTPYLDAIDSSYISATVQGLEDYTYTFANTTLTPQTVFFEIYARTTGIEGQRIAIDFGQPITPRFSLTNTFQWHRVDLSTYLYSQALVNDADFSIYSFDSPGSTFIVDAARLTINSDLAGRITGGDVFDIYAYPENWVSVTTVWKNLQHVKMLPIFSSSGLRFHSTIEFYFDYYIEDEGWIEGWGFQMNWTQSLATGNDQYLGFNVTWFQGGNPIKMQSLYMFYDIAQSNISTRFWIDLWYNQINASSTVGGRVNAYYFPMKNNANAWLRWLTGNNWGTNNDLKKQSMLFTNLRNSTNHITYAPKVLLTRMRCNLTNMPLGTYPVQLSDFDVFDVTFGGTPFSGIQTPVFDETLVPVMPQGGFLGAVWTALGRLATAIGAAFGPVILGFWNVFVGFMDSIFTWGGWTNGFSEILNMIGTFIGYITTGITLFVSFLVSVFTFITGAFVTIATYFTQWISSVLAIGTNLTWMWNQIAPYWSWVPEVMIQILPLIMFFFTVWLFSPFLTYMDARGVRGTKQRFDDTVGVLIKIMTFLWGVVESGINLVLRLIEGVPVVE